jgi:hypothetical protein
MKHFVKGKVECEKVTLIYCPTNQMVIKIYWQSHYRKSSLAHFVVYSLIKHFKKLLLLYKNSKQEHGAMKVHH